MMGINGEITNGGGDYSIGDRGMGFLTGQADVNALSWLTDLSDPSTAMSRIVSHELGDDHLLILNCFSPVGTGESVIQLSSENLLVSADQIGLSTAIPTSDSFIAGRVYTRTAAQLGGTGSERVLCMSVGSAPSAPSTPTVCKEGTPFRISWFAVAGADGYIVQRDSGSGFSNWMTVSETNVVDYEPFASQATEYSYRVKSFNQNGTSAASPASTAVSWTNATAC